MHRKFAYQKMLDPRQGVWVANLRWQNVKRAEKITDLIEWRRT